MNPNETQNIENNEAPEIIETPGTAPAAEAPAPVEPAPAAPATPDEPPLVRNKYADRMNRAAKKLPKKARIAIGAAAAVLLVGGGIFAALHSGGGEIVTEDTAVSTLGFLETYVEGYGQTSAKRREELGKDIKGTVTEVLVSPGATVAAGDTLLIINPEETRKELDEAMESAEEARKAVEAAQRSVRTASEAAAALNVTAPFSGKLVPDETAGEIRVNVGDELSAGTTLGLLVDDTTLRLPLYFSYAYINSITEGMPATVSIAYTMSSVPGTVEKVEKIERISPDGTKTFRVVISFPNPGTLTKGMDAVATLMVNGFPVVPADQGKIEYSREKAITLESGGKVTAVSGLSYYRYSAGQSIVRMSNPDVTDALASAKAGVESQQKMYQKQQEHVAELEKLIADSTVKSPIDGIVTSMDVQPDQKVDGSRALCVVADLSSIVVNATIPELDIDKVQPGQFVSITMDSGDGSAMFTGSVLSVSMQAQTEESGRGGSSLSFPIVIEIDESPDQTISPDRSVEFQITTASSENCIVVPSSAIVYTMDGAAVYARQTPDMTFENAIPVPEGSEVPDDFVLVPVETGIYDESNTEILSGIGEGVEVFLAAPQDAWEQYEQQMAAQGLE